MSDATTPTRDELMVQREQRAQAFQLSALNDASAAAATSDPAFLESMGRVSSFYGGRLPRGPRDDLAKYSSAPSSDVLANLQHWLASEIARLSPPAPASQPTGETSSSTTSQPGDGTNPQSPTSQNESIAGGQQQPNSTQ